MNFTPAQAQILELMFAGRTHKEMARELNISVSAIKHRLERIYIIAGIRTEEPGIHKTLSLLKKFGHFEVSVKWVPKV